MDSNFLYTILEQTKIVNRDASGSYSEEHGEASTEGKIEWEVVFEGMNFRDSNCTHASDIVSASCDVRSRANLTCCYSVGSI